MTFRRTWIVTLAFLMLSAQAALAEVKTEERTRIEFPGMLGGIMKTFGGKAAKEGVVNKVALKGDRKMTTTEETAELIDLAEEKVYQIDLKKKTYTVLTFAELKRQFEEGLAKAKAEAAKASSTPQPKPDPKAEPTAEKPEFAVDFKLQESGQKKVINGYDCREIVMTVTVREKDKTAQDGSMVLTTSTWLTPRIAAMKELEDFDRRYAEKLLLPFAREVAEQMGPAMGMYPGLQEAMSKLEIEKVNMDGTAVLTVIRAEAAGAPEASASAKPAPAEQNRQPAIPTSIGGLLGGLGRRAAPKPEETDSSKPGAFMTTNHELVSVSTRVSDSDVSIPSGFKENKK